ncbi:MAG: peptide-methionine (S)-S-oxide reductase [Solirubrobacterales bacterium]|nr:peptide-methionine (S)-S-oxide reductase [Solirubrobacterales bacterium]
MFKFRKRPQARQTPAAPPGTNDEERLDGAQRATFAAGCFWGVEAAFREIEGLPKTRVGYTGGQTPSPTYEQVCSHATGHAEAVEVWFDPAHVTRPGSRPKRRSAP